MTDETKHAPEPWHYVGDSGAIEDDAGRMCAEGWGEAEDANSRRIVACVNACAGITTAALEAGALAKLLDATAVLFGSPVRTDDAQAAWDAMDAALRALGRGTR